MRKISSNLSKIVFTLFFLSFSLLLNAQENNTNKRYTKNSLFLLNSFENGIASWHDGKVSKTKFNFNVVLEEICYVENNKIFSVANIADLDSIKIGTYNFLVYNSKIYELIYNYNKIKLLVFRDPDLSVLETKGAYGQTTRSSSISKKTSFISIRGLVEQSCNIKNESDIEIPINKKSYLLINDELIYLSKWKIKRYFSDNKDDIKSFFKEKNLDLKNKNDIIDLIEYLNKFV